MKTFLMCSLALLAQAGAGLSGEQLVRVSAAAPELLGSHWLNTPYGKPVTLASRWRQRYWPAVYLVDSIGRIRYAWEGELNYTGAKGEAQMVQLIEMLLMEARQD